MARPHIRNERGALVPDTLAELLVRRDTMNPRVWRLAWGQPDSDIIVHDTGECDPAGRFPTLTAARAYGLRHYGQRAFKID